MARGISVCADALTIAAQTMMTMAKKFLMFIGILT